MNKKKRHTKKYKRVIKDYWDLKDFIDSFETETVQVIGYRAKRIDLLSNMHEITIEMCDK